MENGYWLKRVVAKLNVSFLNNNVLSKWIPDDENPAEESRALDTLELVGIIKSPGFFEGDHTRIKDLKGGNARSAPTRQIIDFDYDKFIRFCETHGLNPTANGTSARLEIVDGVQPIIYIEGARYAFRALSAIGLPQKIVDYAWSHPDRRIPLDELRKNISMVQLDDECNLNQVFDKKNLFGKHGLLQAFAEVEIRSFLLKGNALLTPSEIAAIQTNSTNRG